MTATIPGERETQLVFEAATPAEFRKLLGTIRETSGLSCGQIAVKTKMPRSTAYSLPDVGRPGLPSNPEQVRDFVRACGLSDTQIDLVLDVWTALHNELENAKNNPAARDSATEDEQWRRRGVVEIAMSKDYVRAQGLAGWLNPPTPCPHGEGYGNEIKLWTISGDVPQRKTTATDLLHYVLRDEDRTRRALRVLLPIVAAILALVCALVIIAVTVPGTAQVVVAGMVMALLTPLVWVVRGRGARTHRKKK